MINCGCHIFTDEDGKEYLIVCPKHYGEMLGDSQINYGLCTNIEANKELSEKYGVPMIVTEPRGEGVKDVNPVGGDKLS